MSVNKSYPFILCAVVLIPALPPVLLMMFLLQQVMALMESLADWKCHRPDVKVLQSTFQTDSLFRVQTSDLNTSYNTL